MNEPNPPKPLTASCTTCGTGVCKPRLLRFAVHAGVVGEALGMAAKAECVIRLVEIAGAEDEFAFIVALEPGAGNDVEDSVSPVAELRAIAAAIHFDIFQILGIKLRADILRDGGVDDGNAIEQPGGLVSAADVQHVVRDVGSRNVSR